jgi:DNA-binding transcriptional LysR family regulator
MNFLEHMRIFSRVAELSSFTQAADTLGLPKATVSTSVQQLENQLGARLLHRTTRKVLLTQDGQAFYERCLDALADMDELQTMFQQKHATLLKGRVRIDMSTVIAQDAVLPRLPELLHTYPHLEVEISSTERRVDLVREGFDCVLRAGKAVDPGLIAKPLCAMRMVNCVSAQYAARFGVPQTLADLQTHQLVHYVPVLGSKSLGFEYLQGDVDRSVEMAGQVTVNNALAYQSACLAGLGIIQAPSVGLRHWLASGQLLAVLPAFEARPLPLSLVYASRRNQSARVRVVMDWLAQVVAAHCAGDDATTAAPSRGRP